MVEEENPFVDPQVAREWIESVEGEKGLFRDKVIYPRLESWAKGLPSTNVLEIGAGQGICSEHVGSNLVYVGVEPSSPLVARAQELYSKKENRSFVVGDAYNLPFPSESFGAVFSINVLFHIGNLDKFFSELARVLKFGGEFFIITANPRSYPEWIALFDNPVFDKNKVVGKVNVPVRPMSKNIFYQYTQEEIEKALAAAGLKIEKLEELSVNKDEPALFLSLNGSK